MATYFHRLVFCLTAGITASHGYQWTDLLPDATVKYECTGSTAVLPWTLLLGEGEEIVDIRWLYDDRPDRVMALLSHGTFVALPAFSTRTSYLPNAGIALHHVTVSDTGSYSVEVTGRNSDGVQFTLRRSVILQVTDGSMTSEGPLHASQRVEAAFSNTTQQWHAALACGTFNRRPPFDVEWTTPTGQVVPSSRFENGQFLLLLDNPVAGGSYTCNVSRASASVACFHGNHSHAEAATVTVDRLEARLAVVDAQQGALVAENNKLKQQLVTQNCSDVNQQPHHPNGQDNSNLTEQLQLAIESNSNLNQQVLQLNRDHSDLSQQVGDLRRRDGDMKQRVEQLEQNRSALSHTLDRLNHDRHSLLHQVLSANQSLHDVTTPRVSFHARDLKDQELHDHDHLVFPMVEINDGNRYDSNTGTFTAPRHGTYWFMASIDVLGEDNSAGVRLMVDHGAWDDYLVIRTNHAKSGAGSLHAVARLRSGQKVWVECTKDSRIFGTASAFSGFLLYAD